MSQTATSNAASIWSSYSIQDLQESRGTEPRTGNRNRGNRTDKEPKRERTETVENRTGKGSEA